jgi:hypothetical protein
MARAAGLPGLYLVAEVSDLLGRGPRYTDVDAAGFDAGVYMRLPARRTRADVLRMRVGRKLGRPEIYPHDPEFRPAPAGISDRLLPCVYPNWDNTPRSGTRGLAVTGSSPEVFGHHVRQAVATLQHRPAAERLLWVKSWNEWAEGNYLEPDLEHGHAWLEALHHGLTERSTLATQPARVITPTHALSPTDGGVAHG